MKTTLKGMQILSIIFTLLNLVDSTFVEKNLMINGQIFILTTIVLSAIYSFFGPVNIKDLVKKYADFNSKELFVFIIAIIGVILLVLTAVIKSYGDIFAIITVYIKIAVFLSLAALSWLLYKDL